LAAHDCEEGWAEVGDKKAGGRRRAVGTRDRVMSYLLTTGEISDASGMASTALAEAIGYPGSSIAFAQLLSGMERSGLIEREVRGKRTYRITPTKAAAAAARSGAAAPRGGRPTAVAAGGAPAAVAGDFDYDELARRLLMQVVQRLGTAPGPGATPAEDAKPGAEPGHDPSLARAVAGLEHKLASVRSKQQRLTEENARLREQLRAAQESLAQAEARASAAQASARLDSAEASLLERLLSPLRDQGTRQEEAGTG
jgi:DNA-binding MarR family transcriptional regulator